MRAISKMVDVLFDKFFGSSKSKLEEKEIPEIQCNPTFWRFLDEKNELILGWDMSETIQLVDNKKLNKLRREHVRLKYPNKSRIEIAVEMTWKGMRPIMSHIVEEHFEEIKLDVPSNVVEGMANSNVTVSGIKNIVTNHTQVFPTSRSLIAGDVILTAIRTIPWDVVNLLLGKEPAKCKQ